MTDGFIGSGTGVVAGYFCCKLEQFSCLVNIQSPHCKHCILQLLELHLCEVVPKYILEPVLLYVSLLLFVERTKRDCKEFINVYIVQLAVPALI